MKSFCTNSFTEVLMSGPISCATEYPIDIVAKRETLVTSTISIENITEKILLKANNTDFKICFDYSDIIGIISEEDMDNTTVHNIKLSLKNQCIDGYLDNLLFVIIYYYPYYQYKSCNIISSLCCQCTTHQRKRMKKSIEILISFNLYKEFKREFYQTKIFHELNPHIRRKMMILINPNSGKGQSPIIWERVKGIFTLANIDTEIIFTQYSHHAYEIMINLDKNKYDGIVSCSGDGTLHEIINGIFDREDKYDFIKKIPIGCLPGGSSNALCETVINECKEQRSPEINAFIIAKGFNKEIDIQEIELLLEGITGKKNKQKIYSFLSVTWSIIADVDIESERIRWCGSARFSIYAIIRLIWMRQYFGTLYYLPKDKEDCVDMNNLPMLCENELELDESIYTIVNDQFNYFIASNLPFIGEDMKVCPIAKINDGYDDITIMKASNSGKYQLTKYLLTYMESGNFIDLDGNVVNDLNLDYIKTKFWRLIPKRSLDQLNAEAFNERFDLFYSIDGEKYPISPIQVKTLSKALKVFFTN